MPRKRTKEEAIERIENLPNLPNLPFHKNVPPIYHAGKKVYDAGKTLAKGLVMLDPLGRLADAPTVIPFDMIAIPAHEYFRLSSDPTYQIYIRGGETIIPTGGNVQDVQEVVESSMQENAPSSRSSPKKKRKTARQIAYGKAFKQLAPKYKLKSGKWKKDGFKNCVKAAHKKAGGKK